jgi:hypothetical protein
VSRLQPSALVHSIQARLKNAAREGGRPFAELLELYAVERFLHRLGRSPHRDHFVLKGALLLRHWLGADTRPTRDIDLLGPVDLGQERLRELLGDLLRLAVEDDGVEFSLDSIAIRPIRAESPVLGLRAKFDAHLGRTRLRYQVDVGLGDAVFPETVELVPGGLLGMPMASVRAYTPYTTVAEKLEAMVVLGDANSRTKDYYDLLQLPRALAFDGPTLVESIRRTFARRATRIPAKPLEGLADAFASDPLHATRWLAFLQKNRLTVAEADLIGVVTSIRRFAQPILDAAREDRPFRQRWPMGGPWREEGRTPDA